METLITINPKGKVSSVASHPNAPTFLVEREVTYGRGLRGRKDRREEGE